MKKTNKKQTNIFIANCESQILKLSPFSDFVETYPVHLVSLMY